MRANKMAYYVPESISTSSSGNLDTFLSKSSNHIWP